MKTGLTFAHPAFAGWIGVGREDITPPVGIFARNWGAAEHETAEGIHRPLTVTALTLQRQPKEPPLVLVAADLGWWRTPADEWYVRSGVLEALALDPARVMVNLSHTHSGPSICREDADKPGGDLIAPYLDRVRAAITQAARSALAARQPAVLTWGQGCCTLAANRDLPDPEKPRLVCGFNAALPAEDTLLVGRVTAANGTPLATLVHYACHPTTLAWQNRLISPDYVGALRELVEAQTGGAPCLFLLGACGELAPREQYTADTSIADAHGRELGYAALSVLAGMLPPRTQLDFAGVVESGAPLAVWQRAAEDPDPTLDALRIEVELPLKADLPTLAEIEAQLEATTERFLAERLRRKRRVRQAVGEGATTPMPVWLWRVGGALLIGYPNEAYSLLQTELRRRFPHDAVAVMNVVNGHTGYLPPEDLYNEDLYPVWQTPFDRGSLERTIEACTAAARTLAR
jgi:hypothetical protein